jgi:nicotinamide riboside kinase
MTSGSSGPQVPDRAEACEAGTPLAFVIAIVGAESTGPANLAHRLGQALAAEGRRVAVVPDALREFHERLRRAPEHEELPQVALEQTRLIATAAATYDLVVSAATALTVAAYNERVFGDVSLYPQALAAHKVVHLTLFHTLDVPQPSNSQHASAPMHERADSLLRGALTRAGCGYSVIASGAQGLAAALTAARHAIREPDELAAQVRTRWQWVCDRCGDVDCERHLLAQG